MDDEGLVLYAGTNVMSDAVAAAHDPKVGIRPSLGDPAEKVQPGLEDLEVLEVLTTRAVAATMRARHADARVQSATLGNLAVYAGLTEVGATIASLPRWAGGHFSHHPEGAAGIRGHRVVELPYDPTAYDVDVDALPGFLERERPELIVLGGTVMLFPHRLGRIVGAAKAASARVLYDASHVAGLIAGERFQDPLADGVDVVTFSTYKSYGGPPGGAIATNDPEVAERVFAAVYPGLTANYDAGRFRSLGLAAANAALRRRARTPLAASTRHAPSPRRSATPASSWPARARLHRLPPRGRGAPRGDDRRLGRRPARSRRHLRLFDPRPERRRSRRRTEARDARARHAWLRPDRHGRDRHADRPRPRRRGGSVRGARRSDGAAATSGADEWPMTRTDRIR